MSPWELGVAVAAGIILFLFGIEHFSREVQAVTGQRFRRFLAKGTKRPVYGVVLGAAVTAVIQSSTATSVIAVGLVNAGLLSFTSSLGLILGANIGTTVTTQLVALHLTDFAPVLLLIGFVAGYIPFRWRILSRSVFYFGLVFFSLNLVSQAVEPIRSDPRIFDLLAGVSGVIPGILTGAIFTAVVQSSSVTTGITIVLLAQGLIDFETGLYFVLGANVGTTITSILAAASLDASAKRTALAHTLYNVGGVLLFLPFLGPFKTLLQQLPLPPEQQLATAHLIFNITTTLVFLAALRPFARLVEYLVKVESDDPGVAAPSVEVFADDFEVGEREANVFLGSLLENVAHAYTAAVLALETRDQSIRSRADRLSSMVSFGLQEGADLVGDLARGPIGEQRSSDVLHLVMTLDHVRQLVDSVNDLLAIEERLEKAHRRFSLDAVLEMQRVYPVMAKLLKTFRRYHKDPGDESLLAELKELQREVVMAIEKAYASFLDLVRAAEEGVELADFLSVQQRLRTKVSAFAKHLEIAHRSAALKRDLT